MLLLFLKSDVCPDVSSDLRDVDPGKPPHHRAAVGPNQEFLEVPLDVRCLERVPEKPVGGIPKTLSDGGTSVLEESEEALFILTVHITLLKQLKIGDKPIARANIL